MDAKMVKMLAGYSDEQMGAFFQGFAAASGADTAQSAEDTAKAVAIAKSAIHMHQLFGAQTH